MYSESALMRGGQHGHNMSPAHIPVLAWSMAMPWVRYTCRHRELTFACCIAQAGSLRGIRGSSGEGMTKREAKKLGKQAGKKSDRRTSDARGRARTERPGSGSKQSGLHLGPTPSAAVKKASRDKSASTATRGVEPGSRKLRTRKPVPQVEGAAGSSKAAGSSEAGQNAEQRSTPARRNPARVRESGAADKTSGTVAPLSGAAAKPAQRKTKKPTAKKPKDPPPKSTSKPPAEPSQKAAKSGKDEKKKSKKPETDRSGIKKPFRAKAPNGMLT